MGECLRSCGADLHEASGHDDSGSVLASLRLLRAANPAVLMTKGRGTGRKVKGGGKSRVNKDHRMAAPRRIHKYRYDDICAAELRDGNYEAVLAKKTVPDIDKPGAGQFYCVSCARYYVNEAALTAHNTSAKHRRRLKELTTKTPYSHEEANAAAGRGATDRGPVRSAPAPMSS